MSYRKSDCFKMPNSWQINQNRAEYQEFWIWCLQTVSLTPMYPLKRNEKLWIWRRVHKLSQVMVIHSPGRFKNLHNRTKQKLQSSLFVARIIPIQHGNKGSSCWLEILIRIYRRHDEFKKILNSICLLARILLKHGIQVEEKR